VTLSLRIGCWHAPRSHQQRGLADPLRHVYSMNNKNSQIEAIPKYLERLGLGLAILAAGCVAIAGAVELIGFTIFADEKASGRAAAWVQAIVSPLAIVGAFFVARYQANRQEVAAAEQREIARLVADASEVANARSARLDALEREAARLVYAQAILIGVGVAVEAMRQAMTNAVPDAKTGNGTVESYGLLLRRVGRLDPAIIGSPRSQLVVTNALFALDAAYIAAREAEGETAGEAMKRMGGVVVTLAMALSEIEDNIQEISDELTEGGRAAVEVLQPFSTRKWWREWMKIVAERRQQTTGASSPKKGAPS